MNDLIIQRLAVIKQLYSLGLNQSYDPEPINGFCLLSFHDSADMFMKLCLEKEKIKDNDNLYLMNYFTECPKLKGKELMNILNQRRNNLKHKGALPSTLDIENCRASVTEFFELNTPIIFGVEFKDISLVSLIKYLSVKEYLSDALVQLNEEKYEDSIIHSQISFKEFLSCYEEDKSYYYSSFPFQVCEDLSYLPSALRRLGFGRDFDAFIDKTKSSFDKLEEIVRIIGFGIDYKEYWKFKLLSPDITFYLNDDTGKREYQCFKDERIISNKRNAQYCFDFVIDSALKLQRVNFDIKELRKE